MTARPLEEWSHVDLCAEIRRLRRAICEPVDGTAGTVPLIVYFQSEEDRARFAVEIKAAMLGAVEFEVP